MVARTAGILLAIYLAAISAMAQSNTGDYIFLIASGLGRLSRAPGGSR